jgi:hypothetical protein
MLTPAPAIPLLELGARLQATALTACDIRSLLSNAEFQSTADRNSQMIFLREFAFDECFIPINRKTLSILD